MRSGQLHPFEHVRRCAVGVADGAGFEEPRGFFEPGKESAITQLAGEPTLYFRRCESVQTVESDGDVMLGLSCREAGAVVPSRKHSSTSQDVEDRVAVTAGDVDAMGDAGGGVPFDSDAMGCVFHFVAPGAEEMPRVAVPRA